MQQPTLVNGHEQNVTNIMQGTKLAAATGGMLHISVQAAPAAAATAQATAKRVIGGVRVQYMPSGLAARKLQMSPRSLGKLTG